MKKLLVLTIFLSSLIMTSFAHAKWTKVGVNDEGTTYYVDFETVKQIPQGKWFPRVFYWTLRDHIIPQSKGSFSDKLYIEARCFTSEIRGLTASAYSGQMGKGKLLESATATTEWFGLSQNHPNRGRCSLCPDPWNDPRLFALQAICNHLGIP